MRHCGATVTPSGSNRALTRFLHCVSEFVLGEGSLGARINELKQRVIAENPHRFAVAVPRKSPPPRHTHTFLQTFLILNK